SAVWPCVAPFIPAGPAGQRDVCIFSPAAPPGCSYGDALAAVGLLVRLRLGVVAPAATAG
ncbi:MAG TPA: hypothetical protein VMU80_28315, partial [Bryobacteraceae bacterium]|nr:hypothetical protein [Bryobacteraceae bacterium]